jgi:hypothetical protein
MNTYSELPRLGGAYDPGTLSLSADYCGYHYLIRQRGRQYIVYIFGKATRETSASTAACFPKNALESLSVTESYLRLALSRSFFLQEDLFLLKTGVEQAVSLCEAPAAFTPPPEDAINTGKKQPHPFFAKPDRQSFFGVMTCVGAAVLMLVLAVVLQTVDRTLLPYFSSALCPVCLLLVYHKAAKKLDIFGLIIAFALNFAVVALTAQALALLLSLIIFAAGIIIYFYRNGLFLYEDNEDKR